MGPKTNFNGIYIELDNPARSYFAGQVIQGRVVLNYDKPKKLKEITLLLEGRGRVRWSEQQSYVVHTSTVRNGRTETRPQTKYRTVTHVAHEEYIVHKVSLFGDGQNFITLPEGAHTYPFQFILPINLPSSFTTKIGLVSYCLEVEIRRPLLKPNKKMAVPFTVNGILDLNMDPRSLQPQETNKAKGSNFFACRKGQLGFALKLHRTGYVPGEIIQLSCELSNSSNKKVNSVKLSLRQITTFSAQGHSKVEHKVVCDIKGPEVDPGDHEMWSPDSLVIPPVPPSRLGGYCRIIDVAYFIHVEMKISGLSSSITADLPVVIGTVPLRNTFEQLRQPIPNGNIGFQYPTPPAQMQMPGPSSAVPDYLPSKSGEFSVQPVEQNHMPLPSAPMLTDYPDLPPPTYAEAVMAEKYTWDETDGYSEVQNNDTDSVMNVPSGSASAPPLYEFVPNYVTYKR